MNCCEFREKHSDFVDDLLNPQEQSDARAHLTACAACRRFDATLRAGLDALRALPDVGLSHGFRHRLQWRLRDELAVRVPVMARWSGAVGTLLLVATIGFVGWDLLQSRATHRRGAEWAATTLRPAALPLAANVPARVFPAVRFSSLDPRSDAFHPINSILVTDPPGPAARGNQVRYDLPAVWGGP